MQVITLPDLAVNQSVIVLGYVTKQLTNGRVIRRW